VARNANIILDTLVLPVCTVFFDDFGHYFLVFLLATSGTLGWRVRSRRTVHENCCFRLSVFLWHQSYSQR